MGWYFTLTLIFSLVKLPMHSLEISTIYTESCNEYYIICIAISFNGGGWGGGNKE